MGLKCVYAQCEKQSTFNFRGSPARYCNDHKQKNMINVHAKRCEYCDTLAAFGYKGHKATRCAKHKDNDMTNVTSYKCKHDNCEKQPVFGYKGVPKPLRMCSQHKQFGMINLVSPLCIFPECNIISCFGSPRGTALYCHAHKGKDDINLRYRKCELCLKHASFGFGVKATRCKEHSEDYMINISYRYKLIKDTEVT